MWATFDFPKNDAIYNIDLRTGRTINRFNAKKFDKNIKEIEGIAVDNTDDALWVVDDEAGKIYQITKSGNLKKFVDLKNISPEPESPESIAYDEPADTLWIAENRNNRVYNISKKGELLSYFSVSKLGITNLQGVELDNGGNLLLTARGKSKIYKVTKRGELLSAYEGFSDNFIDIAQAPLSENFNAKKITEISSVEPSGDDFSFGVIGDPEINTKSNEIFEKIIKDMENKGAYSFGVFLGDITLNGSKEEYELFYEKIKLRKIPLLAVLGDRDSMDNGYKRFNYIFGESYYSFAYKNSLFIILDNSSHQIGAKQMQWLEEQLKKDYKHKFVFMHVAPTHPFYVKPLLPKFLRFLTHPEYLLPKREVVKFARLFKRYKADIIFSGGTAGVFDTMKDRVNYITSGGLGSQKGEKITDEKFNYYFDITISGGKVIKKKIRVDI